MPPTPYVVIDTDIVDDNIARMAEAARAHGQRLRPHYKTHKLHEIADRQRAAGATSASVATIGEAEVFDKVGDLFIAYPLNASPAAAARINALRSRVILGIDSVETAARWGSSGLSTSTSFAIEVDSGHHRSGVPPHEVRPVAEALDKAGFQLMGLFTFPGHSYAPDAPRKAADDEAIALQSARAELGRDDLVLSGGSTPSAVYADAEIIDEIRPGVYVFNDAQQLELGTCTEEQIALKIRTTVVSRREDLHQVIVDAGSKIVGSDRPGWTTGYARVAKHPEARVPALSEHHGTVTFPEKSALPAIGEELEIIPNHVCPVLNLVDTVRTTAGETWEVAARGKNG
ncbi:alanine racemase [Corynebacterium yudongzhengii]|uniref:Alanine racemase n=1 Tax=Corynebacterium yudongzhengii TaxID=2080740 RepID=A0A2U1T646_9CORY|nr:alanine racemase [Corynebacterium yudongzhengii]AWB83037.1 alanine racemase [Corynebacterium yudongzhengii]PWC01358.1 alanine racemase [Corynebacterium yudongzhengii]